MRGLVVALSVGLLMGAPPARGERPVREDTAVADWIQVTLGEIASHRVNPPRASRALALVSVAMRDAALAGAPADDAAVAGAASTVLAYLFPDGTTRFQRQAERAAGNGKGGFALGRRIGRRIVARGRSDGSDVQWNGQVPVGPGLWVPTPPAFVQAPLEPLAGTWRPWHLTSGSQFRPGPPPQVGGDLYREATRAVYDVSRSLTPAQEQIAAYWADGPGTVTPPGHWDVIALELVRAARMPTQAAAVVFATLNTAQADAFIACWDAKFAYWTERPVTAIRRAIDPGWLPYITTPPFPSYVSGHSTTSGAAAEVLAHYFPAAEAELRSKAAEAAVSRLYGGIHFDFENDVGLELGRNVAGAALGGQRR